MVKWICQGCPSMSSACAKSRRMAPAIEYQRTPTPAPVLSWNSLQLLKALPTSANAATDHLLKILNSTSALYGLSSKVQGWKPHGITVILGTDTTVNK